jgi:hypothetical protein
MDVSKIIKAVKTKLAVNFKVHSNGHRAIIKDSKGKEFDAAISFVKSKKNKKDAFYIHTANGFIEISDAYYLDNAAEYPPIKELAFAAKKYKREMEDMLHEQGADSYERYHDMYYR